MDLPLKLALLLQDMDVVTGTTLSEETATIHAGRGTPSGVTGSTTALVLAMTTVARVLMTGLDMAQAMDVTTALLVSHSSRHLEQ